MLVSLISVMGSGGLRSHSESGFLFVDLIFGKESLFQRLQRGRVSTVCGTDGTIHEFSEFFKAEFAPDPGNQQFPLVTLKRLQRVFNF